MVTMVIAEHFFYLLKFDGSINKNMHISKLKLNISITQWKAENVGTKLYILSGVHLSR